MEAEDASFCQALLLARRSLSRWLGYSGEWDTAANGVVMEQQRVVPPQNLAPVVGSLGLLDSLQQHSPQVARLCFELICKSLQIKKSHWHTMLITVKNSAYAWRQMIFYLSFLQHDELDEFLNWGRKHWAEQSNSFRDRFELALLGLEAAAFAASIESSEATQQFLGWKKGKHWLSTTKRGFLSQRGLLLHQ